MRFTLAAGLLSLLPAALGAQPAAAQSSGKSVYLSPMGEPFTAPSGSSALALWVSVADADKNGFVSLAEMTSDAERFFVRLDADADGRIGGLEMTHYEERIAPAGLRAAAGARPVGSDTKNRTEKAVGDFSNQRTPRKGREGLPGGMTGPRLSLDYDPAFGTANVGTSSIPQPVAMTDTDMSGSVTREEFTRAAARRFALIDANKNGLLDTGELSGRDR